MAKFSKILNANWRGCYKKSWNTTICCLEKNSIRVRRTCMGLILNFNYFWYTSKSRGESSSVPWLTLISRESLFHAPCMEMRSHRNYSELSRCLWCIFRDTQCFKKWSPKSSVMAIAFFPVDLQMFKMLCPQPSSCTPLIAAWARVILSRKQVRICGFPGCLREHVGGSSLSPSAVIAATHCVGRGGSHSPTKPSRG